MDEEDEERVTLAMSMVSVFESLWKRHCFESRNV